MNQYQALIDKLTLEEKASLLSGANFWNTKAIERVGIPSIMLTDGPHGLRKQAGKADHLGLNKSQPATCFPTAATLANSWDETLLAEVGEAIGREAAEQGVGVLLGPGLNIVRNPLGGRNFEYYSEDPYVSGKLAAQFVKGVQQTGVMAAPKHFAVNSQELLRMSINEVVDERSLREIYLEGFRHVVQEAEPGFVMTAYNKVNDVFAGENTHLLQDILYKEWRFKGVTVTDWGGNNNRIAGLKAGNHLEMPSSNGITDAEIVAAVRAGTLDEKLLNRRVAELLKAIFAARGALKAPQPVSYDEHHARAIEAAAHSIVLLKNEAHILPLKAGTRVAVIGDFAKKPRYQGAGSSLVNPTQLDTALEALGHTKLQVIGFEPGFKRFGGHSPARQRRAMQLAQKADVVLLFLGLDESIEAEGIDRTSMSLPIAQLALARRLTEAHKKVVVILAGGAPVEMPFANLSAAILHTFLPGQGGGTAVAQILTGIRNPSGKLSVSYPRTYLDVPSAGYFPGEERASLHKEALFVGYRYYDTKHVDVLYPFGHGLSYTTFAYTDIVATEEGVSFTVQNVGNRAGAEVAQVYIKAPIDSKLFRAKRELKGFAKVSLQPGELQRLTVHFDEHTFAYYNVREARWAVEGGSYGVEVGSSLNDIRLFAELVIADDGATSPYEGKQLPSYTQIKVQQVSNDEFAELLGRPLPPLYWDSEDKLTLADTVAQLRHTRLLGRMIYHLLTGIRSLLMTLKQPIKANYVMFIINMPFDRMERLSGGTIRTASIEKFLNFVSKKR